MGEIVWAKTREWRDHLESHTYGQVPADSRTTIFASPDKVAMVEGVMMVGANRNSDKKYYFWRSVSSVGFFRNRAGNLQPYRARRPVKAKSWTSYYPETSFFYLEEEEIMPVESVREFRKACKEHLGLTSVYDLYPMAEVIGLPERFSLLPANLRPHMRTTDWNEYLTSAFGKTRVTPEFVKAAKNTEPYVLSLAHEFRGLVPEKTLVKFVQNTHFNDELMEKFIPHTPKIRLVLKGMDERSRVRLIGEPIDVRNTCLIKTISNNFASTNRFAPKKVSIKGAVGTWKELTHKL